MAEQQSGDSTYSRMIILATALSAAGVGPPVIAHIDNSLRVGWSERDVRHLLIGHAVAFGWARGYWVRPSDEEPGRWSVWARRPGFCAGLSVLRADGFTTEFDALTALVDLASAEATEEHAGASVPRADGPAAHVWCEHRLDDGRVVHGLPGTKYARLAGAFGGRWMGRDGVTIHPGNFARMPCWWGLNGVLTPLTDEELEGYYGDVIREHRSRRTP